ncbi:hypothetical protein ABE347_09820 [Bacillus paralicheniformis]|nr:MULTISPECIES: hypothetical protein [Bacillus]MEC4203063.1 hypothetical protein [Bacillus sp. AAVF1]TWK84901.1 hypothetical protein CHCC20333_1225 [Bacillus paralicheniformis]
MRETIERVFCRFKTQAWPALDNPVGKEKIVHAGDACFR